MNEPEPNTGRHRWTSPAVVAGVAYLGWRAVATLDGVPAWLGWPVFVIEALGVLGVLVLLLGLARRPLHTDEQAHATSTADVILRVEAEPLGRIASTLAGLRHADNIASTTILTFTERQDVRRLAEEHDIEVYYVDPEVDATGLKTALRVGKAPFLIVVDAGDVPMAYMADVLVRHAYDGHIAGVRGAVDSWATDSAEHDSRGRHVLRFEREALYPAAGRAAVLQGSGVLLRRWAIEHVGVPEGPRRAVELRLSMRLRKAGLEVVAPADPVLVSVYAANTAAAVALERRRDTAAVLRMLYSTDGPLLARGLKPRDRVALLATFVRPLSGIRRALFITAITACLLAGELPMRGHALGFVGLWLPWMVLQAIALRQASFGRLDWGDRARWSFITMGSSVAALFGAGDPVIGAGRMQPRRGAFREFTSNRPIAVTLSGLAVVVPLVGISDRFTDWLPSMPITERAALLAVTMWAIVVMLDVMRCLNGARQLRRVPRITTEFPGSVDEVGATIIDITPYGAGAITDELVEVGQEVKVRFDVPSLLDRTSVEAAGVVRSVRVTPQGSVSGIEFISMDRRSSDALYEYCEVIHSQDHFAAQLRSRVDRRAQPAVPRIMIPPRRMGVRLSAAIVLLGAAVATAPPLRTTEAAPVTVGPSIIVRLFQDHNANGVRNLAADAANPALDSGVAGATVTATCLTDDGGDATAGSGDGETSAAAVTAVDAGDGVYQLTNLPVAPCRVEVTELPDGFEPGPLGTDNGGLVQFAVAGAELLVGVNRPDEFCQDNPRLVTSRPTFGDPVSGAGSGFGTIKSFSYGASGSLWGGPTPTETPVTLATNNEIGSVFGLPMGRTKTLTFGEVNGLGDLVAMCDMAPVEVGNRIWSDENGNGVQDSGEPAVPGVPVSLDIGNATYTVVTDSNGMYRFSSDSRFGDAPGVEFGVSQMTVGATATITFPISVTIGGTPRPITERDAAGSNDALDSDADEGTGRVAIVVGGAGENDHTHDVGYASRYSLGDMVWDDRNNDGTFQVGEPGIDGVTVRLSVDADDNGIPDSTAIASQTTSSGGYYRFTDLAPGTYVVEVATPSGFRSSTGQNASASGPSEGAATPDPDDVPAVGDGDDNGSATDSSGTIVRSRSVTLGSFEPLGEPATPGHTDTTDDERTNATVDFGFFRPLSIGNFVWDDADDSGTVDAEESGIPGVTVMLRQGDTVLSTTTTDVDGRYLFPLLSSGQYEVEVVAPAGYRSSTGRNHAGDSEPAPDADLDNDDEDDNGTNVFGGIRTATVDLTPTAEPTSDIDAVPVGMTDPATDDDANYTLDFGLWRPVSVGNLVWSDVDDDGVFDIGEPGVPGVPVRLYAADGSTEIEVGADGILDTGDDAPGGMVTDTDGHYRFTNLRPATYRVQVDVPTGWRTSSIADGGDANDDTDHDNNGASRITGSALAGHVELAVGTEPANDGDSDAGSNLSVDVGLFQPVPAMSFVKAANGCDADTPTGTTGPPGGCPPGDGTTNPVVPTGSEVTWTYVASNAGNVSLDNAQVTDDRVVQSEIDCNGGGAGNGQPFTLAVGATLTCTATGIAGGGQYADTATLTADAELTPSTVGPMTPLTEMSHHFGGDPGLAIKTYTLLTDPGPTVGGLLTATAPVVTGTDDADLPGGADMVANHVVPDGTFVWWAYAVTNTGNVQLSDLQVVDDRRGLVCQGFTLAAGATTWCVLPGSIGVAETGGGQYGTSGTATGVDAMSNPSGPASVGPVSDPTHAFVPTPAITIESYTNDEDADAARTRPHIGAGAGVVWRYVVANSGNWPLSALAVVDDLEGSISCPVLSGAPSRLLPGQSITCTETGISTPQFAGLDYVNVGSVIGTPVSPSTGLLPNPVADDPSGYRPLVASIGDRVWLDGDVDGVQDEGEPGVAAVEVRLLTPDDVVVATTITDPSGRYGFSGLNPGTYLLEFVPPPDHLITERDVSGGRPVADELDSDADRATRRTAPTILDGGENDLSWDLGIFHLASLGDRVWYDRDLDGVQNDGEAPVVGATVRLFTAGGTSLASTTTDGAGSYAFNGLRPGSYVVQFEVSSGYGATARDLGVDPLADELDSDAHPQTGQSQLVELGSGEHDSTIDAGVFQRAAIGDRVWHDDDMDGVQDSGEPGVPDVVVSLYRRDGIAVDSATTDADGIYRFAGLQPGVWSIGVSNLAGGMTVTAIDQGPDGTVDSDVDPVGGIAVATDLAAGETDLNWDAGISLDSASNVPPPGTPGPTVPPASRLPVTGGEALQLLVFASALLVTGLLMVRARRPRTL